MNYTLAHTHAHARTRTHTTVPTQQVLINLQVSTAPLEENKCYNLEKKLSHLLLLFVCCDTVCILYGHPHQKQSEFSIRVRTKANKKVTSQTIHINQSFIIYLYTIFYSFYFTSHVGQEPLHAALRWDTHLFTVSPVSQDTEPVCCEAGVLAY